MTRSVATSLSVLTAAIAAAAAMVSTSAFADDPTPEPTFVSSKVRSEVQGEVTAYRRQILAGYTDWALQRNEPVRASSGMTPQEVKADYIRQRMEVIANNAEHGGDAYFGKIQTSPRARTTSLMGAPSR